MEQKRLSYAKSFCCNFHVSRVILRKFHFMYFLRHLPIKCRNQIRTWYYLHTTLPITINKNTGSTYRITQS